MNKIPIRQIVIVEGKYDKITLENILDATIVVCDGFGIFKNKEQQQAIKEMAHRNGAIILTDSDSAGGVIRSHLLRLLQGADVFTLYTPAVAGKERRKTAYSKEGLLGVEGTDREYLRQLFEDFRAEPIPKNIQTKHLYEWGITGVSGAVQKKARLLSALQLPPHLSNNALLKELNRRFSYDEFCAYIKSSLAE